MLQDVKMAVVSVLMPKTEQDKKGEYKTAIAKSVKIEMEKKFG